MAQEVIRLGPQGRVVIPAGMRRVLNFSEGDALVIRQDGNRLVLERRDAVLRRLYGRWRPPTEADVGGADPLSTESGDGVDDRAATEGVA